MQFSLLQIMQHSTTAIHQVNFINICCVTQCVIVHHTNINIKHTKNTAHNDCYSIKVQLSTSLQQCNTYISFELPTKLRSQINITCYLVLFNWHLAPNTHQVIHNIHHPYDLHYMLYIEEVAIFNLRWRRTWSLHMQLIGRLAIE